MPTVNTTCVQARYDEQLARLYYLVNYDPDSVLSYALSGVDLNDVGVIVAADVDSLPNLQYETPTLPDGMVYFVQSLGILVISSNNTWLTLDGTVVRTDTIIGLTYTWGRNSTGELGDNSTVSKSSPVSVVGGFTNWCQVSTGGGASAGAVLALRSNGTAWGWGNNTAGRLGDCSITNRSSPVSVVGGITDWCDINTGDQHTLAIRQNGTAWAWGESSDGRLGDNNATVDKSSPVSVVGGFTDWCQISAGGEHSLAVRTNGTAWSWGESSDGRLGDNNATVDKSSPVSVVGGFTDWCQISAGHEHSLAVRTNGTAWSWGIGTCGRLGDNTLIAKSSPVSVVGGFTDWCQISAGQCHSLAVRQNGTAWAWGLGLFGRLGDNTTVTKSSPVSVVGGFTDWCQISAGCLHSLATRTNGTAWAWGDGGNGKLGIGCAGDKTSPVSVIGGFTDWCQVSAGASSSSGVRTNGTLWTWGSNSLGQLGDNTTVDKSSPISIVGGLIGWFQVAMGANGNQNTVGITNLE